MSYLNRFLIEEDTQFECAGVAEFREFDKFKVSQYLKKSFESHFDRFSNKSNSDFICHFIQSGDVFLGDTARFYWKIFEGISYMATHIGSERLECVQKEHYEKLYNEGGQIKYDAVGTFDVHQSIGNDIDDLYDRIKMNKINFADRRLLTDSEFPVGMFYLRSQLVESPYSVKTFHLSMLSDQEERKIHSEDTGNREFDYFKKKTKLSKKEQNYALSLCWRKTIHMEPLENGMRYYREIIEPDPWEERIKTNYEELQRLNEKREIEEALEYCQTQWVPDSSDYSDSN